VLLAATLARAEPVVVLLGRPPEALATPTEAQAEIVNRVRGELLADGFGVEPLVSAQGADRARVLREASRAAEGPVSVALFLDDDGALDLTLLDTATGRTAEKHIEGPAQGDAPEVFARHVVDVLRASLLDFAIAGLRSASRPEPRAKTPAPRADVEEDLHRPATRWALEGGAAAIGGFSGAGLSAAPVLRLRLAANRALQLRLTAAGMGSSPAVQTDRGRASIEQGLFLVDATAVLGQSRWIRPLVTLGAGVYYVGVSGTGNPPYQGLSGNALALAMDAGIGVSTSVTQSVDLTLEAHVVVAEPGMAVRFIDEDIARVGQPTILVTLTLADWI
jgi:hypothetical protein